MIRRLLVALPLAALLVGAMTTGVAAAKPPPPPPPTTVACPTFPALITFTLDNEITTQTTVNGNTVFFTSGVLLATVTNESTGQSIKVNASGSGTTTVYPDGSATATSHGPLLEFGLPPAFASEFGIPPVGLYDGNVTITFDSSGNFKGFSYSGDVTDLCAALS
jgi:hypothetical protein